MPLSCGDTFYTADDEDDEPHLWVVITPTSEGEVVIVNVTTRHGKSEILVTLKVGDHPFIRHESVIAYAYSTIKAVDEIEQIIRSRLAMSREPVSQSLLERVQNGLLDSEHTPNGVKYFYREVMRKG